MWILHVAAEAHPLIKTGGLADVVGALPAAQRALGHEVAVLMPGYPEVRAKAGRLEPIDEFEVWNGLRARLMRGKLAGDVDLLVIDQREFFGRDGNPYTDASGGGWSDNLLRFALLGRVAAWLCRRFPQTDVLHAHDWHAGLAPAYLRADGTRCASCFTIHNLAYQGIYGHWEYALTGLPEEFYRFDGLEFHGDWSFMKAALSFSDAITTVSPTYAREILTADLGMNLDPVLNYRRNDLHGILNGVDYTVWNPETDAALTQTYSADALGAKAENKRALQQAMGLDVAPERLLIGIVSRLTLQKGLDLVPEAIEGLLAANEVQLLLLGSGSRELEQAFTKLASRQPRNCAVRMSYDEAFAHRIVGGADAILVPSRFEPCGLTQLYGLRYGTLPIVRRTGGLADTVKGYTPKARDATGFVFETASALALQRILKRAIGIYRDRPTWQALMRNAMRRDFGWQRSAQAYVELYARIART
jgi:starch synthase